MKRLTAIICPGDTKRWMVAFNLETGTTSQGRTVEEAMANLKEATELYLQEKDRLAVDPQWDKMERAFAQAAYDSLGKCRPFDD